jgi:hypothetical protein
MQLQHAAISVLGWPPQRGLCSMAHLARRELRLSRAMQADRARPASFAVVGEERGRAAVLTGSHEGPAALARVRDSTSGLAPRADRQ